jgi:hypothetical protein
MNASMHLITRPHLDDGDMFYEALVAAHEGRSVEESQALNARLILLLANHIGALPVLHEALEAAAKADNALAARIDP